MNYQHFTDGNVPRLDISRFVLYLDHTFDPKWTFRSETEIEHVKIESGAGGEIGLEQAYLEYHANDEIGWRGGLLVLPIGIMNQEHEPNTFYSVLRPLFDQTAVPSTWREIGTGIYGNLSKTVSYQLYLSEGLQPENATLQSLDGAKQEGWAAEQTSDTLAGSNASHPAVSGKLNLTPTDGLEIGVSGYVERGTSTIFSNMFSLGDLDAQYEKNGWRLRAEGAIVSTGIDSRINGIPTHVAGGYAEAAFDLLSLTHVKRAQLFAFARYESYSFDSTGTWFDHHAIIGGLAYKPMNELILKADYQWSNTDLPLERREWALGAGYVF